MRTTGKQWWYHKQRGRSVLRCIRVAVVMQALWLLAGCCVEEEIFTWTGLEVVTIENSGERPAETTGLRIPHQVFGLRLKLSTEVVAVLEGPSSLVPSAYATSCAQLARSREKVDAFTITKLAGPDPATATSIDVTDDFVARESDAGQSSPSLDDFWPTSEVPVRIAGTWPIINSVDLFLLHNQAPERDVRFVITMELSDGRRLADTTAYLELY